MGFHEVSWALKQTRDLDPRAKLLLIAIADAANNKDHCMWRGKKSFMEESMLKETGVKAAWLRLISAGYIRVGFITELDNPERVAAYEGLQANHRPKIHKLLIRESKYDPQEDGLGGRLEGSRGSVRDPLRGSPQTDPKPELFIKPENINPSPAAEDRLFDTHVNDIQLAALREQQNETEFENWWKMVPRKAAKGAARKAYRTAREKVDGVTILEGTRQWVKESKLRDPEFVCFPATWLNQERWGDEVLAPKKAKGRDNGPSTFEALMELKRRRGEL